MQFLNSIFPLGLFIVSALAFVVLVGNASAEVTEPPSYWLGVLHGEVPATLSGAQVIRTEALAELLRGGGIISIYAASVQLRPYNLPNDAIWRPVPHENIAGTIWIPGIGEGNIQRDMEAFSVNG